MSKHTGGPGHVVNEVPQDLLIETKNKVNTNLLAAAPDLLEACEHAAKTIRTIQAIYKISPIGDCTMEELHNAITKAKGGSSE